ncbi:MAG: beta-lactamase family protein [Firmicutes bacterium]|nr:beta-lactamase family protein [Bacillota bacterium]
MNDSILTQFRLTAIEKGLCLYGISIYQQNKGTISHRWRSDDKINLYSASKTFTAVAIGICRDEGRLSLYDRVIDFFPEYKSIMAEGSEKITIRDLLHMASGKDVYWFSADEETKLRVDWAELFFKEPQDREPGQKFFYSSACSYMLSRIVEKVSGNILRDFLVPRLFTPLGIHNPLWHTCPKGHTNGAMDLFLTTDELARLGITLLHDGIYQDRQIVSKSYIQEAITDILGNNDYVDTDPESRAGYGYQLWRCTPEGIYRIDGKYGQFSIVIPDKGAVVTITAHQEKTPNDILRAVYHDILPKL